MTTLNQGQQIAFDGITELFSSSTPKMAILTGAAGTGKTFLTKMLMDELNPLLSAMTHKAAAVMAKATDAEVITLAKLLKQRKFNSLEDGKTYFKSAADVNLGAEISTVFIDESSMMNKENFSQVIDALAGKYNILFIGDKYQLPPVKEEFSCSLSQDIPHFSLTEPMRAKKGSGIDRTAISIRTAMEKELLKIEGMKEILESCEDVIWIKEKDAIPMMIEEFKSAEDVNDVRMISFTNRRVEQFNYHLKLAVTGDAEKFKVGDFLMANETFSKRMNIDGSYQDVVIIQNNDSVMVEGIEENQVEGVQCYTIELDNGHTVHVPVDRFAFQRRIDDMKSQALKHPYGSKERKVIFAQMFALKESFADLRLNYAQTVHKAQGSTYQTCFFDLNALNHSTMMGKKLLYTGVTRAAKKLVLFK